ncbi:reverse transcriptase domain-containing protein [Sphingomonas sp. 179-A 2A2 NHS]|uniref:reverse transcriptase domain-containing protein n=1 Tax=Sphingomonas sp. 179-A 2A2 NHS TaxID=3374290 RepID=UPI00387993B0
MAPDTLEAVRQERLVDVFDALPRINDFSHPARAMSFTRPKRSGGVRRLTSFYWEDDARMRILKSTLIPFADLHDSQFMLAQDRLRRGPASVRENLLQALRETEGGHVFLQFDIRDFFGSISHAWLEGYLDLDRECVKRFVHTGEMLIVPTGEMRADRRNDDASKANGRSGVGIPQGSALSSLVAEMAMAEVLRSDAVFGRVRLFAWSDNLGVLAPRDEALAVEELVRGAFARHEAGPFHLEVKHSPITSEFKFLGVWYRKVGSDAVAFVPDAVATGWANDVCADVLIADAGALSKMERRIRSKLAAWSWWDGAGPLGTELRAVVKAAREALTPASGATSCNAAN